jgi:hypothetical protein
MDALAAHGPCPEHRFSFANVAATMASRAAGRRMADSPRWAAAGQPGG